MLKNYIKIAFRKLRKNKLDSLISIGGLSVGIACCMLLVAFVHYEWSHDEFHEHSEQIYRVLQESYPRPDASEKRASAITPIPLGEALRADFPEVEEMVRVRAGAFDVKIGGRYQFEEVYLSDPGYFDLFSFPLIAGEPSSALENPNSIVLSRRKAEAIFGSTQVVGETVTARWEGEERALIVTGVAEDIPANSSISFEYLVPFNNNLLTISENQRENWHIWSVNTFVLLNENVAGGEQLERKFPALLSSHLPEETLERRGLELSLQPLEEIYLTPETSSNVTETSNPLYSWILAGIALVVLAIAGINFMSLTLSRASARSGEIGVRKVVGAGRRELREQFLGEAFLTCLLAFGMGGLLAELMMPWFRELVGKPISFELLNDPLLWLVLAGLLLITTLITGGYPSWVISRQNVTAAFISRTTSGKVPGLVKGLIVVQFAMAIALLSSAWVMYEQMNFISSRDLGFEPENVVEVELNNTDPTKGAEMYERYSQEARLIPGVESLTAVYGSYGRPSFATYFDSEELSTVLSVVLVDAHFLQTMGIDLVEGRFYSPERPSEFQDAVLINRAAAEEWGWENPTGRYFPESNQPSALDGAEVIGVVENYHVRDLYHRIEPVVFRHYASSDNGARLLRARLSGTDLSGAVDRMRTLWNEMFPDESFNYALLDDIVDQQYTERERWRGIMEIASGVAFLLACFGLFGLAALAAQRRTKEIGIRKVLGATVTNIIALLSRDFVKLVAIGFVIAVPIAYYAMDRWLADFAYKIEMGAGIFAMAGGAALLIALLTVSWQSVRAALANPVDSLRSE